MHLCVFVLSLFFAFAAQAEVCKLQKPYAKVYEDGNFQNRSQEALKPIGTLFENQIYDCNGMETENVDRAFYKSGSVWIAPSESFEFYPKLAGKENKDRQIYLDGDPGNNIELLSDKDVELVKKHELAKIRTLGAMTKLRMANNQLDDLSPGTADAALARQAVVKAEAAYREVFKKEQSIGRQLEKAIKGAKKVQVGGSGQRIFVEEVQTDAIGIGHLKSRMYHRYKVRVEDTAGNLIKSGWLDAERTRSESFSEQQLKNYKAYLSEDLTIQTEAAYCLECHMNSKAKDDVEDAERQTSTLLNLLAEGGTTRIAKQDIIDHIDKNRCLRGKDDKKSKPLGGLDKYVTEGFKKYRRSLKPQTMGQFKRPTKEESLMIDMLARTLWGEMRGGFKKRGLRYYKAVARIVMNRAEEAKSTGKVDQIHSCHESVKGPSYVGAWSCAIGALNQFTMWGGRDVNYDQAYCIEQDIDEWKAAIAVASEAILSPDKFKRATEDLEGVRSYTSLDSTIKGLKPIERPISIDGLPVDHGYTLSFWE